jgi:FkbM family methyltransferase
MKTKHYCFKKIVYSIFSEKYYHNVKTIKIIFDYVIRKDYDGIYKYLSKILPKDAITIDIGANMGQYMSRISSICENGKIISIEPIPDNVSALQKMKHFLKNKNVYIVNKAISSKNGTAIISTPRLNNIPITTQSTLLKEKETDTLQYDYLEVKTTTIDNIVDSFSLSRLDFIKIDTEGFDNVVLNTGKNSISYFKPLLKIESNPFCEDNNWLFESGYDAFKFIDNKIIKIENNHDCSKLKGDTYLAAQDQLTEIFNLFPGERI